MALISSWRFLVHTETAEQSHSFTTPFVGFDLHQFHAASEGVAGCGVRVQTLWPQRWTGPMALSFQTSWLHTHGGNQWQRCCTAAATGRPFLVSLPTMQVSVNTLNMRRDERLFAQVVHKRDKSIKRQTATKRKIPEKQGWKFTTKLTTF